jgi:hypothetical protein
MKTRIEVMLTVNSKDMNINDLAVIVESSLVTLPMFIPTDSQSVGEIVECDVEKVKTC